jgi:hypothetical protein
MLLPKSIVPLGDKAHVEPLAARTPTMEVRVKADGLEPAGAGWIAPKTPHRQPCTPVGGKIRTPFLRVRDGSGVAIPAEKFLDEGLRFLANGQAGVGRRSLGRHGWYIFACYGTR